MNDAASQPLHRPPMMLRDVLLILVGMVLFVFALEPHDHTHGERRREGEPAVGVQVVDAAPEDRGCWQSFDAEACGEDVVRHEFGASLWAALEVTKNEGE